MEKKLIFNYDKSSDILYIGSSQPYPEQDSEELEDEIIARFNPETREIENLEILFFSHRLQNSMTFELPVIANMRKAI